MRIERLSVLKKIVEYAAKNHMEITIDSMINLKYGVVKYRVKDSLSDFKKLEEGTLEPLKPLMTVDQVKELVYNTFNTTDEKVTMRSKNGAYIRRADVITVRQVVVYFCKEYTDLSLAKIGRQTYGQTHANVINAVNEVNNRLDVSPRFREIIKDIRSEIINNQPD